MIQTQKTSDQSNLTRGRIDAAYGRFSRIRQVAPMCTPYSAPQSACAPYRCCPLLSRFEYMDHRTCPGMSSAGSFSPSKLPFHSWASGPPSNTQLLGPMHRSPHPNGLSIGSAVFARLAIVTDRPTDHATPSVAIGGI